MNHGSIGILGFVVSLQLLSATGHTASKETPMPNSSKPWEHFRKPDKKVLKEKLSPIQFEVTQEEGTERPFKNEYWDNHQAGLYVDVVSGEPLFSSADKFESGTGWPSFTQPLGPDAVVTKVDRRLFSTRTEVRSKYGNSHLGHVFDDGPPPTGKRYCMNSAAMRFVPADQLKKEGYEEYLQLFQSPSTKVSASDTSATTAGQFEIATLAGGCFWGVEELIRQLPGVVETNVGYTGGSVDTPNYEIVKTGTSGHAEAIEVKFDSKNLTYESLLRYFFRLHDPTTQNKQGNDVGTQYRSAIFYHSASQRDVAERVKLDVDKSGKWKKPLVTEIVAFKKFFAAEDYHQDYLKKNPGGYTCHYLRD